MVQVQEAKKWLEDESAILIDVREAQEYNTEHIASSILMPLSSLDIKKMPTTDKKIIFHCRSGGRSQEATRRYQDYYKVEAYNLEGGIMAWKKEGYPTVKCNL